jgi:hypothetical protein
MRTGVVRVDLLIVVGCLAVMLTLEWLLARRRRRRDVHQITLPAGAVPESATMISFDDAERAMTSYLLSGALTRTDYRDTVAALAGTDERLTGSNPLDAIMPSAESLDQLCAALPSVRRSTLSAAVALARHGATIDGLTRMLGLTDAQAIQIVATAADSRS